MPIKIEKAERIKSKLRLGIAGPSGAGKTYSSLKLAKGLIGEGGRICIIDTENGSADLYAHLFDYDIIKIKENYAPKNYIEAIHAAEEAAYDVIIIDSLSHAWVGQGGLLDQVDKKGGNSFTAWRDITPQHNLLIDTMLKSPVHIIATMRSKTEYGTDTDGKGKMIVKKLGLAPVQREGMDYEFTIVMDVNQDHYATASKDRTDMFADEVFQISEKTGARLLAWLSAGRDSSQDIILRKKTKILQLISMLGIDRKNGEAVKGGVLAITRIALTPENFDEIIARLEVTVKERGPVEKSPDQKEEKVESSNTVSSSQEKETLNSEKLAEDPAEPQSDSSKEKPVNVWHSKKVESKNTHGVDHIDH